MLISGKTENFALIGTPVEHSFSPFIYNEAFKLTGFDGNYTAFDVEPKNLSNAIDGIRGLGIKGVNVTAPYKEKVIPFLDLLSTTAKSIGAVNTILNADGELIGFNTDYVGFTKQLIDISTEFHRKRSWKITLIGAGGASRAVIYSLLLFFEYLPPNTIEKLYIVNRDRNRAMKFKGVIGKLAERRKVQIKIININSRNFVRSVRDSDIFINASPIGFKGCPALDENLPNDLFKPDQIVIDLVYNPEKKSFIECGNIAGAKVYTGLDMLLYQAEASFKLFTGKKISFKSIKEAILKMT